MLPSVILQRIIASNLRNIIYPRDFTKHGKQAKGRFERNHSRVEIIRGISAISGESNVTWQRTGLTSRLDRSSNFSETIPLVKRTAVVLIQANDLQRRTESKVRNHRSAGLEICIRFGRVAGNDERRITIEKRHPS